MTGEVSHPRPSEMVFQEAYWGEPVEPEPSDRFKVKTSFVSGLFRGDYVDEVGLVINQVLGGKGLREVAQGVRIAPYDHEPGTIDYYNPGSILLFDEEYISASLDDSAPEWQRKVYTEHDPLDPDERDKLITASPQALVSMSIEKALNDESTTGIRNYVTGNVSVVGDETTYFRRVQFVVMVSVSRFRSYPLSAQRVSSLSPKNVNYIGMWDTPFVIGQTYAAAADPSYRGRVKSVAVCEIGDAVRVPKGAFDVLGKLGIRLTES